MHVRVALSRLTARHDDALVLRDDRLPMIRACSHKIETFSVARTCQHSIHETSVHLSSVCLKGGGDLFDVRGVTPVLAGVRRCDYIEWARRSDINSV